MRTILGIVLCFCVANLPLAKSDCFWPLTLTNIDDIAVNKEIFNHTSDGEFTFKSWKVILAEGDMGDATALGYFRQDIQDQTFYVSTTDAFETLNSDAYTDGKDQLSISIVITLTCDSKDTDSTLLIQIKNTNQNAPEFSDGTFDYSLPMPIMPKTDFSLYGDEIIATDIDFSTNQITFSMVPDHFTVIASKAGNKTFQAVFRANQIIQFTEPQQYTLTAADTGSPPKSTSITITLNADPTAGFDSPTFSSAYYSYNYTSGETPTLIPTGDEIVINSDKSSEAQYILTGDYADNFDVTFTNSTNIFSITLKSDTSLPEEISNQIILTLSFTTDVSVSAVILITVVKEEPLVPAFKSDYYIGTYDIDTNLITLTEAIEVKDASSVTISGDKASLFTINSSTNELTSSQLSKSDFDDNSNLFLTLIASSVSKAEARAPVVISLATTELLQFDSVSYYGSYTVENNNGVVTLADDIGFEDVTDFTGISITVDNSYSTNFKIELDLSKWKVIVLIELNSTIINGNNELAIPITAAIGESTQSTAILILKLPAKSEINFDHSYYTATYVQGENLDTVVLHQDILIEGADLSDVTLTPEDYTDNFAIAYNSTSTKYEITVTSKLDPSLWDSETQLIITITALKVDESATSSTVLVLKLPVNPPLKFENNHYTAEYTEVAGSQATVTFIGASIKITGADDKKIESTFEGYNDNFKLEYDSDSSSYNIIVEKNLDSITSKQLIITITASETGTSASTNTVLVLTLPEPTTSLHFENNYYEADYIIETSSTATINLDVDIKVTGADNDKIDFSFEEYNDNFKMEYDSASSSYKVIVEKNLNSSTLTSKQLVITITASETGTSSTTDTVLVLTLPEPTTSLHFKNNYYEADYIIETSSTATINLDVDIKVTGADNDKIDFSFEEYNDNFKMEYDPASSSYKVIVEKNLNSTILASQQLVITITATETDTRVTTNTVLVLRLPKATSSLNFENKYYEAEYIQETSSSATVQLTNSIKVTGADNAEIEFTFEEYNDNFKMVYDSDSSSYMINVEVSLDLSMFDDNTQLIITITATTTNATGATVLILQLPEVLFKFEEEHYAADYVVVSQSEAIIQLDKSIVLTGGDSQQLQFSIEGYEDNFRLNLASTASSYNVIVELPLDDSVLSSNTHLVMTITATVSEASTISASTVLVLRLPSARNIAVFESNYYVASYISTSSETDHIETSSAIKINSVDFAEVDLIFEGYDDNFVGTCDSSTLLCTITVRKNLNETILSSNPELVLSLTANNADKTRTGITVLLVKLPLYNSTFTFTNQHYSAIYTLENEDTDKATVELKEDIFFDGANSNELDIVADEYSDQFGFTFDSKWNVLVTKNLDEAILSSNTELIISLTASITGKSDYAKSTLVIKLPDKISMAFSKPQYSGEYVISGDTASIQLTDTSEIVTTNTNVQITLDSYKDNFEVQLGSDSKWTIIVKIPLDNNIFTENTQLKLLMTITKVGVEYGEASLIIKLPTPSFTKGSYSAKYSDDGDGSITADEIEVDNVEAADIQVNLSDYNEYIYTDLVNSKWVVKLNKPIPASIIQTDVILTTTLQAIRKSDDTQLASSTLIIKLPDMNLTGVPTFNQFTFYGEYKNSSDKSTVELKNLIGFSSTVTVDNVAIEEGTYSPYFALNQGAEATYDITVIVNLPEDVLSTESSVVLTLIASTEEGKHGYAALVINLPKITREVSVQFKDEKILYSGTYENGIFKSLIIPLETNSTDDDQISAVITTDLELDSKYFSSTYENKSLTINVDGLPEEILKNYSVIPLKLAITDKDTGDTVYAVVNVNVKYNSGGNDANASSDNDREALFVAVIILALLLVAVIVATILLWYFKIRNARYVKMEEEEVEKQTTKPHPFTKNLTRQASTSLPSNSSLRRPTGLPVGFLPPDSPTEEASNEFEVPSAPSAPENDRKVVFDDHVQNINEYGDNEESSDNLQNVAARRPTQFVFAYPMEAVLDSPTDADERRESSDYDDLDSEKKKSVLFDEKIERMHIDIDEEDNGDNSEGNESDDSENAENIKKDNLSKFKSELEVKLDELIPTEVLKENSLDL